MWLMIRSWRARSSQVVFLLLYQFTVHVRSNRSARTFINLCFFHESQRLASTGFLPGSHAPGVGRPTWERERHRLKLCMLSAAQLATWYTLDVGLLAQAPLLGFMLLFQVLRQLFSDIRCAYF